MKSKVVVTSQLETISNILEGLINVIDGNKITKHELMSQLTSINKKIEYISDIVSNEDNPPINFK